MCHKLSERGILMGVGFVQLFQKIGEPDMIAQLLRTASYDELNVIDLAHDSFANVSRVPQKYAMPIETGAFREMVDSMAAENMPLFPLIMPVRAFPDSKNATISTIYPIRTSFSPERSSVFFIMFPLLLFVLLKLS